MLQVFIPLALFSLEAQQARSAQENGDLKGSRRQCVRLPGGLGYL